MNEKIMMWAANRLAKSNECRIKDIDLNSIKVEKVYVEADVCPEGAEDELCNCIYTHAAYSAVHITAKSAKSFGGYGHLDMGYVLSVEDYEKEISEL